MIQALIASFGYAGGVTIDKILLSKEKIKVRTMIPFLFICLCLFSTMLLPKFGGVSHGFFNIKYFALFALMIVVATTWTKLYYSGIQRESLHEFELIMLMSPLATIVFAMIFLPSERNFGVFAAGIIACTAFMWSRLRSHHIQISKTAKGTVLAMLLMAFETILIRELLNVMSPVSLYFWRTLAIAIVSYFRYKPKFYDLNSRMIGLIGLSSFFGVAQMILKFYGFKDFGVIATTMVLLLGPFMVYLFSFFYFHEKSHYRKDIICASVVILCILYTTMAK